MCTHYIVYRTYLIAFCILHFHSHKRNQHERKEYFSWYIYLVFFFYFILDNIKCFVTFLQMQSDPSFLIFYWLLSNCEALGIVLEPCEPLMSQSMPYFTIYNTRCECLHFFSPAEFIAPFFSTVSPHLRLACPVYLVCVLACLCRSVCVYMCVCSRLRARPLYSTL